MYVHCIRRFPRKHKLKYPLVSGILRHQDFTLKLRLLTARMILRRHGGFERRVRPLRFFLPRIRSQCLDSRPRKLQLQNHLKFLVRRGERLSNRDFRLYSATKRQSL